MKRCDTNGDGKIGVEEFELYYYYYILLHKARAVAHEAADAGPSAPEEFSTARAMKKFNRLDADSDGFVDGDEVTRGPWRVKHVPRW